MTRTLYAIEIAVTLQAPFIVNGSDPGRLGLDAVLLRDRCNRLVLPGTLLQGRIRHAWTKLRDPWQQSESIPKPSDWFGDISEKVTYVPRPARLMVGDLFADAGTGVVEPASRIEVSDTSGAAEPGALFVTEQSHAPRAKAHFAGRWRAWLAADEPAPLCAALLAGLLWHSQLGAERSVGFGRLLDASVTPTPLAQMKVFPAVQAGAASAGEQLLQRRLLLRFDQAFCAGASSRRGNVFGSSDVIPGAALKAALARMLSASQGVDEVAQCRQTSTLAVHFEDLRFTHAFPSACGTRRSSRLPLSLVAGAGDPPSIFDAAQCKRAQTVGGRAPTFQIDWKTDEREAAKAASGWGGTRTDLRVRTEIDKDSGRQAVDNKLFAYECRVAEPGTVWHADIWIPPSLTDAEVNALWAEIRALLECGLGPIGKTDAWALASLHADLCGEAGQVWASVLDAVVAGAPTVLQLQTPALLFRADRVADRKHAEVALLALYQEAFSSMQQRTLRDLDQPGRTEPLALSHFFAAQSLSGGNYLWHRFRNGREHYLPYVLTDAGSVFVFDVADADLARNVLGHWLRDGLPVPDDVKALYGDSWNTQPYIPQNGYGEIAVNLRHGFPSLAEGDALCDPQAYATAC